MQKAYWVFRYWEWVMYSGKLFWRYQNICILISHNFQDFLHVVISGFLCIGYKFYWMMLMGDISQACIISIPRNQFNKPSTQAIVILVPSTIRGTQQNIPSPQVNFYTCRRNLPDCCDGNIAAIGQSVWVTQKCHYQSLPIQLSRPSVV